MTAWAARPSPAPCPPALGVGEGGSVISVEVAGKSGWPRAADRLPRDGRAEGTEHRRGSSGPPTLGAGDPSGRCRWVEAAAAAGCPEELGRGHEMLKGAGDFLLGWGKSHYNCSTTLLSPAK